LVEEHNSPKIVSRIDIIEKKLDFFTRNAVLSLFIISSIGLFLRLYYFPYNVPLTLDALEFFFYATDTSILGRLPTNFSFANNGWPIFLSFFFSIFRFDNALDYMTLQRVIAISISVLTIIPVYCLCNRFFDKPYAIVGAAIFAFEPRIIQNSILGLTEPLYIMLVTLALVLFLSPKRKMTYSSFGVVAFSSLVRAEGLFVFFPLLIMFFVRYRKERKIIAKCILVTSIFILLVLPMAVFRIQTQGNDALTSRILEETNNVLTTSSDGSELFTYLIAAVENFVKFSGWSLIPIFIFFVPLGLFLIFRKRTQDNITVIIVIISMILPVFYAFSVAPDTRYIYPLFPLFCVLSIMTVKRLGNKIKNRNIFLILIICGVLLSSSIFLDFKKYDYEHQREAFGIAHYVTSIAKAVNDYYPEDTYLIVDEIPEKWPVLKSSIPFQTSIIPTHDFDSLEKYVEFSKNKGLTHLVLDGNQNRPYFLNDVFYHEEKYPYLIKELDSWNHGFKYHIKIYKIDYYRFDSIINNNLE